MHLIPLHAEFGQIALKVLLFEKTEAFVEHRFVAAFDRPFFLSGELTDLRFDVVRLDLTGRGQFSCGVEAGSLLDARDDESGLFLRFDRVERVADFGYLFEPRDVDSLAGIGFLDLLTHIIHHESHFAIVDT